MISAGYILALGLVTMAAPPGPQAEVSKAERVLRRLAKRQMAQPHVQASYVQLRSTPVVVDPLRSGGSLVYRSEGDSGVLRLETTSTVVRITAGTYEVWRKADGVVERLSIPPGTNLEGLGLANVDALLERFRIVDFERVPEGARVSLIPKKKDTGRVRQVRLTVGIDVPEVHLIECKMDGGETLAFQLDEIRRSKTLPASAVELGAPDSVRRLAVPNR